MVSNINFKPPQYLHLVIGCEPENEMPEAPNLVVTNTMLNMMQAELLEQLENEINRKGIKESMNNMKLSGSEHKTNFIGYCSKSNEL